MKDVFVVHPDFEVIREVLKQSLDAFGSTGEYVTKGERNVIKKMHLKGTDITIKKFKEPNFIQRFVYQFLRKSKAKRSFEYASKLIDLGIKTPFPVAYTETFSAGLTNSFYVCEYIEYDFDFRVLIHQPKFPNREEILRQFTAFTFRLHENGINFLDHSPGNTLVVDTGNNAYEFYLIDLNRMRFEPMDFEKRMHNFRRLWPSKTMITIMAAEYAKLSGLSFKKVHNSMSSHVRKFQKAKNAKKIRKQTWRRK